MSSKKSTTNSARCCFGVVSGVIGLYPALVLGVGWRWKTREKRSKNNAEVIVPNGAKWLTVAPPRAIEPRGLILANESMSYTPQIGHNVG